MCAILDDGQHGVAGHGDDRQINRLGDVPHRSEAAMTVHLVCISVDGIDSTVEPLRDQGVKDPPTDSAGLM